MINNLTNIIIRYIVGGNSSSNTLNSVERFDPRDNVWNRIG